MTLQSSIGAAAVAWFVLVASLPGAAAAYTGTACTTSWAALTTATVVYGKFDMTSHGADTGDASLNLPTGVAVDARGGLYVADTDSNSVLYYARGSTMASKTYGQPDIRGREPGTSVARLNQPTGVAADASGRLLVAEYGNDRVLRFARGSRVATTVYGLRGR